MRFLEKLSLCCLGSEPATWLRETTVPSGPPREPRGLGRGPLCVCALCERVCTHTHQHLRCREDAKPRASSKRPFVQVFSKLPPPLVVCPGPRESGRCRGVWPHVLSSRSTQVPVAAVPTALPDSLPDAGARGARCGDWCSVLPGAVPPLPHGPRALHRQLLVPPRHSPDTKARRPPHGREGHHHFQLCTDGDLHPS